MAKLKLTQEQFEKRLAERCPTIDVLENYQGATVKLACCCKVCGFLWKSSPSNMFSGHACPACARERNTAARKKTHEAYVEQVATIRPDIEVLGEYQGGGKRIAVRCRTCGNEWEPVAQSILNGCGCWECGKKKIGDAHRKTHDEFVAQMAELNPTVEILGNYVGDNEKLGVRCKVCGNEWKATPGGLIAGHGCTVCRKTSTSLTEQFILQGLRLALGEDKVLHRDTKTTGLELDIYIPEAKLALEPGGWHWHKSKLDVDAAKRRACSELGIRLVSIYDGCKDELPPFEENCLHYPFKLSFEKGFPTLKGIVMDTAKSCGSKHVFSDEDWKKVLAQARRRSAKMTTEEFVEALASINNRVIVRGKYINNHTKIACECPVCGYQWEATPAHLKAGEACPHCGGRMKRSHEQFAAIVAETNPTVELLGQYVRANDKIEVRCKRCGHVWSAVAGSIQRGYACSKCAAEVRASSRRIPPERFIEIIRQKHPHIEVLGQYKNGTTPIPFKCVRCGSTWEQEPRYLLYSNSACPTCTGNKNTVTNLDDHQLRLFES